MSNKNYSNDPFYIPPPSYDFDNSHLLSTDVSNNFMCRPAPSYLPSFQQEFPVPLDPFGNRQPEPDYCRVPDASTNFQAVAWPRSSPPIPQGPPVVLDPFSGRRPEAAHLRGPGHTTHSQHVRTRHSSLPVGHTDSLLMHPDASGNNGQLDNVAGPLVVPSAPSGHDRSLTYVNEGGVAEQRLHGYVPQIGRGIGIHPSPTSGITLAAGIDFAQFTRHQLIASGFDASWLAMVPDAAFAHPAKPGEKDRKGTPYKPGAMAVGAQGDAAQAILDGMKTPINLTENEASYASGVLYNHLAAATRSMYDKVAGGQSFDKLSDAEKTVVADLGYARGSNFGVESGKKYVATPIPARSTHRSRQETQIVRTYKASNTALGRLRNDLETKNWEAVPQDIGAALGAGDQRGMRDIRKLRGE